MALLSRWRVGALAACVLAAGVLGSVFRAELAAIVPRVLESIQRAGPLAPVLFIAAYAGAAVAFLPVAVLTLAAGALFGLLPGVGLVYVAAVIGASASFVIARTVGRGFVQRRFGADRRVAAIDAAIAARGLPICFLLRLSPVIPFALLNYSLGLTRVRYRDFVLGSVGMVPAVFMYVSAGAAAGELVAVLSGAKSARPPEWYALFGIGLIATVAVTWYVTTLARRSLHEQHLD